MVKLFEKSDLAKIKDPVESITSEGNLDVFDNGVGITLEKDGEVLGCGGVVLHGSDVGEFWLRMSKKAKPLLALTAMKESMKILSNSFPGVKLVCRVQDGWVKGERLARHLGFIKDHIEENYWVYTWQQQH